MARIEYADLTAPAAAQLAQRIVAERGSVLHLYQMLLHSVPVAEGWLRYLTAIRQQTQLNAAIREMVIMRIAHLNHAPYEADQHAPIARREGLDDAQIEALAQATPPALLFNARQNAALAYTDAMTREIQVADPVFQAVREQFGAQDLVELTAVIAAYNMVSRFLEALQIHSNDPR
ncbi:MAG TPA: carboxymuconolactone decarboxylase family protein [Castellaniella sp.]|uniref:carboxymuconolactone decarboxylase family protein n=1 Tax=Castellaniella sp. TaxID=1955812 RepID=UPI002EF4B58C